jgi:Glycine rich protein
VRNPRLGVVAASGFVLSPTPPVLSGLLVRCDSSELSSITSLSGSVSQWDDLSGNGFHLTQSTGSARPTTGVTTQNGRNVIDFATNDSMAATGSVVADWTFLNDGTGATVFIAAKPGAVSDPNAAYCLLATCGLATAERGIGIYYEDRVSAGRNDSLLAVTNRGTTSTCSSFAAAPGFAANTFSVVHAIFDQDAPGLLPNLRSEVQVAGSAIPVQGPRWAEEAGFTSGYGAVNVNAPLDVLTVGAAGDSGFPLTGSIAEILIYNRVLAPLEVYETQEWLSFKWGTVAPVEPWIDLDFESSPFTLPFSGGLQQVRVPTGETTLTVDAYGAQGGNNGDVGAYSGYGGEGGRVKCDVTVTTRDVLRVYVGGMGKPDGTTNNPGVYESAGYNGGGAAGRSAPVTGSGGGGGATDIRDFPFLLADRLVVAPGGGGLGGNTDLSNNGFGDGGTPNGGVGRASGYGAWLGGNGATSSAGGTGRGGEDGSLGVGGNGSSNRAGGGGGGGLYGGEAGEGTNTVGQAGGSGGGGSGLSTGVNETLISGAKSGNGEMVLSW